MDFDITQLKFVEIFAPHFIGPYAAAMNEKQRFVHYCSADTALKIVTNQELWLRNVTVMNDFSEISYGLGLIENGFWHEAGDVLRKEIAKIFPSALEKVDELYSAWSNDWRLETYLTCVSLHRESEDQSGRLSMWRAYGDTALVIHNTPLMAMTDKLGVYSFPVSYVSQQEYDHRLGQIAQSISKNEEYLRSTGEEGVVGYVHHMLMGTAIASKHPGFAEEQEWRIFHRPREHQSPLAKKETVVIGGTPQRVYKLPLKDAPEHGMFGASVPQLLDRIIIGPTQYPYVMAGAFHDALTGAGVENADGKVLISDIPLRAN